MLHFWDPIYHVFGTEVLVLALMVPVTLVMVPRFSASRLWEEARANQVTHIHFVGGVLQLLTALSGMFAGGSAQAAASEASDAADAAQDAQATQQAQQAQQAQAPRTQDPDASTAPAEPPADAERRYREAGLP